MAGWREVEDRGRGGFYWLRQGQREKMLLQQNGPVLFCLVRQYSRLRCQRKEDTIDLVMEVKPPVILIY
jgi:hypothetical protein